jgi:hypothetical protein
VIVLHMRRTVVFHGERIARLREGRV